MYTLGIHLEFFVVKLQNTKKVNVKQYKHDFAIHEAGHAIVHAVLFPNICIKEISMIPNDSSNARVSYEFGEQPVWTRTNIFNG